MNQTFKTYNDEDHHEHSTQLYPQKLQQNPLNEINDKNIKIHTKNSKLGEGRVADEILSLVWIHVVEVVVGHFVPVLVVQHMVTVAGNSRVIIKNLY